MDRIAYQYENHFIRRSSAKYVFPPMLGMIFAQIAPFVDGVCVGNSMGEEALAALGTVGPMNYVFNIIAALGGIGCGVMLSRCSGGGEKAKAARMFSRSFTAMIIATIVLSAAGILFVDPLLRLLCATPQNYPYAREYLIVILSGMVFIVVNFAGDYILANDNNQNLAMAGDIVGAMVNIVVDYVGVFVLHLGIWVVAFGTVFGSFCCCLVYLLHFRKPDRLCRFTALNRKEGDPSLWEIFKPGSAEGIMYCISAIQLLIQNFVLRENAGTSGISNSAVIENLQLVITIIIAGATDAIFPMAATYCGEQNRSGMLMVKRMLAKIGFAMLLPCVVILCVFPQIMIMPYGINDPVMLSSLPLAIRLVSIGSLILLIDMLLIDYLSAIEEEKKANLALIIQSGAQIALILLLDRFLGEDAPWYASLIACVVVLVYLCCFCNHLSKGLFRPYQENLLLLTGGKLSGEQVEAWKTGASGILTDKELELVEKEMLSPLIAAVPDGHSPNSSFTILERDDGKRAVILRYESKKDYIGADGGLPEMDAEDEADVSPDECIRSEFLGARRLMIVLSGNGE